MVEAGAISPLVALVQNGTDETKVVAAEALRHLSNNEDNKVSIAEAGAIPPLVVLAQNGNDDAKLAAGRRSAQGLNRGRTDSAILK